MVNSGEQQYIRMVQTPIPKLVTALAIPTVISMLVTVIYNTADTYFVSQINKSASAAVGAVFSIMSILQAVGFGLGMGSGSLISLKLGEKDSHQANVYAASAFYACMAIGGIIGALGLIFLDPILSLLRCSETMLPYARPYAAYILMGAPISCSTFVLSNALRAQGASRLSMWGMSIGGVLNMILDPIFIFALDMQTGGAALATVLSQCVSFLVMVSCFLRGRSIISIHPKYISHRFADYSKVIMTGIPTICRQGLGSVASAVLNIQAVVYGDAAVAAVTIANKVYILIRNVVIGIGQGFQPVAGYNYGAGNKKRTWQSFLFANTVGTVFCLVSTLFVAVLAGPIMTWFNSDPQVVEIGTRALLFLCAVIPFLAFSTYVNQLLQCLGFKFQATLLASCRQGIFFLPLILLLPGVWGRDGVLVSQSVADFATFLISIPTLVWFYSGYLSENKEKPQNSGNFLTKVLYYIIQWTWGLPQNLIGLVIWLGCKGERCESFHGAAVTRWRVRRGSLGLGMFLFLTKRADRKVLVHEYGHSVQSLILGPLFLPVVGIPSFLWAGLRVCQNYRARRKKSYYSFYPERWANALGQKVTGEQAPK